MELLKTLCEIHATSGNEIRMKQFILEYVEKNKHQWDTTPEVIEGEALQDCLILKFGTPRTAIFAHMDTIGFTVRYENQLIPIGGPEVQNGYQLVGEDGYGQIDAELLVSEEGNLTYKFGRVIERGTDLAFKCDFRETDDYIQSCYMDNRLGVYNALMQAKTLKDGLLVFSCWEEHGGGSVPYLAKYIYENYNVRQGLISDVTWVTDGVYHDGGVVISLRDRNIPRRQFIDRIITIANENGANYQLEVESNGSSDGRELQQSPYPFDWCFIGPPEDNVHSPDEIVYKSDIQSTIDLYEILMKQL
ncbi:MAG: M20/M25/M40 family metallo-hydrolase [Bacteroidota bacterium]